MLTLPNFPILYMPKKCQGGKHLKPSTVAWGMRFSTWLKYNFQIYLDMNYIEWHLRLTTFLLLTLQIYKLKNVLWRLVNRKDQKNKTPTNNFRLQSTLSSWYKYSLTQFSFLISHFSFIRWFWKSSVLMGYKRKLIVRISICFYVGVNFFSLH